MTRTWVFHLETSPGNIPWSLYKEVSEDPRVTLAMSYAVGDNYQGDRIVGTTQEMFTKFTYREGQGLVFAGICGKAENPSRERRARV